MRYLVFTAGCLFLQAEQGKGAIHLSLRRGLRRLYLSIDQTTRLFLATCRQQWTFIIPPLEFVLLHGALFLVRLRHSRLRTCKRGRKHLEPETIGLAAAALSL